MSTTDLPFLPQTPAGAGDVRAPAFPLATGSASSWAVGQVVWYSDWNAPRCLIVSRFGNLVEVLTEYSRRPERRDVAHLMTRAQYRKNCQRCSDGFGSGSWQKQMEKVTADDWQPPRPWVEWLQQNDLVSQPRPMLPPKDGPRK